MQQMSKEAWLLFANVQAHQALTKKNYKMQRKQFETLLRHMGKLVEDMVQLKIDGLGNVI